MTGPLLFAVSAAYLYAAIEQWCRGNAGFAVAFFCYAVANVALYYASP